ncbi:hypothetical protein Dimus_036951 [Dionaea muscipula]
MDAGGQAWVSSFLSSIPVADGLAESGAGVGDSTCADAPMVELPCLTASLAGGCDECAKVEPLSAGSVLREVVGGESAHVDAVVNEEIGGPRSKSSDAAIVDGRYVMNGLQNSVHPMVQPDSLVIDSKVSSSLASLSSFVGSHVGGGVVKQNVQPVHSTLIGGSSVQGNGGLVTEEARVSPLVREALRSYPTDGLQQPPSSLVVPVSGAAIGDGRMVVTDVVLMLILFRLTGGRMWSLVIFLRLMVGILSLWRSLMGTNSNGDVVLWTTSFRGPCLLDLLDPLLPALGVN